MSDSKGKIAMALHAGMAAKAVLELMTANDRTLAAMYFNQASKCMEELRKAILEAFPEVKK